MIIKAIKNKFKNNNSLIYVHEIGNAFYLGCANAACHIHDSVIERNYIHDTKLGGGTHGMTNI